MTHTPGPWNYAGPSDIGRDSYSIYGSGPSNAVMVSMAYTAGPSDYGDAAEANARLIAASPAILEALVDLLGGHNLSQDEPEEYPDEEAELQAREVWGRAQQAIDDATTGQEGEL